MAATRKTTPATEAWELLQQVMVGQRARMFAVASEFELAPAQVMALGRLEPGRPCAMSELAGALRCDNSNVTGIVDRLEARGLVERQADPADRRVKRLVLTDAGRRLWQAHHDRVYADVPTMGMLSGEERRMLYGLLRRMVGGQRDGHLQAT